MSPVSKCDLLEELHLENLKSANVPLIAGARSLRKMKMGGMTPNNIVVPSLKFLNELPKLEWFTFVEANVLDGDLTPCLRLKHAGTYPDRRHYNLKDSQLPKQKVM